MIVPDLNLLVYAFNSSAPQHEKAASWWEDSLNGVELIGIPWIVLVGFIRLLSGRMIVQKPYTVGELFSICDEWLSIEQVLLLEPSRKTYQLLKEVMSNHQLSGTLTTDAFIAATAIEHGAILYSNDGDFKRIKELEIVNPLE